MQSQQFQSRSSNQQRSYISADFQGLDPQWEEFADTSHNSVNNQQQN